MCVATLQHWTAMMSRLIHLSVESHCDVGLSQSQNCMQHTYVHVKVHAHISCVVLYTIAPLYCSSARSAVLSTSTALPLTYPKGVHTARVLSAANAHRRFKCRRSQQRRLQWSCRCVERLFEGHSQHFPRLLPLFKRCCGVTPGSTGRG
jgi:hypothetical protein